MRVFCALLFFSFLFTSGDLIAQKRKSKGNSYAKVSKRIERQLLNNARKNMEIDQYDDAIKNYSELLKDDSTNVQNNTAMALTLYMNFEQPKAVPYFERALRYTKDTIGDIYYFLANSYHLSYNFEQAEKNYKIYLSLLKRKGSFLPLPENVSLESDVNHRIEMCENGKKMLAESPKSPVQRKGKKIMITDMGSNINSKYDDYDAVFTGNDSTVFFTTRRQDVTGGRIDFDEKYYEDIYYSKLKKNGWTPSVNIGNPINTKKHEAVISVSSDGNRLYFYKGVNQGTFYYSDLVQDKVPVSPPDDTTGIVYRIQLGAFVRKSTNPQFEDLQENIEIKYEDGLYKYLSGSYLSINTAHKKKEEFLKKGFSDAFVVAYKGDKRVPLSKNDWIETNVCNEIALSKNDSNERWSHQRILLPNSEISNKSWETSLFGFAVTVADDELYIVSDRDGGVGGRDIYVSRKMSNGSWGPLEDLGMPVNSAYDEDAPYLTPDGNTLYFSSNGHNSIGGFDVFVSYRILNTNKWSDPINLGMPINTPGDDIFFSFFHTSERAFYSSSGFAPDSSRDLNNYFIDFCDTLSENTVRGLAKGVAEGTITISDAMTSQEINRFPIVNGKYAMKLKLGRKYNFSFSTKGIEPVHGEFTIPDQCHLYDIYQEINFTKPGDTLKIENAFFDIAKATLNAGDTSYTEFLSKADKKKLSNYMEDNYPTAPQLFEDTIKNAVVSTRTDTIRHTTQTTISFYNILFDFDRSIIKEEYKPDLKKISNYLVKTSPRDKVEIDGHADSKGSDIYNLALSTRRATSVAVYFVSNGVVKKRMKVVGYGESKPVAPNENPDGSDNPEGRAKNRRTEVIILSTDLGAVIDDFFDEKKVYSVKEINDLIDPSFNSKPAINNSKPK